MHWTEWELRVDLASHSPRPKIWGSEIFFQEFNSTRIWIHQVQTQVLGHYDINKVLGNPELSLNPSQGSG